MAEIPIEVWKFLGNMGVCWLTNLFNKILSANKMPSEWKTCTLIPMHKNNGDIQNHTNYHGIELMSYEPHYETLGERD